MLWCRFAAGTVRREPGVGRFVKGLGDMPVLKNLTMTVFAGGLALGLAACGGGDGGSAAPPEPDTAAMDQSVALAAALEAAGATDVQGAFDDTAYVVAPTVMASHDGTTASVRVTETGTPQNGTARSGEFSEEDEGPAAIAGWTGARFRRGEATETLGRLYRRHRTGSDGLRAGEPQPAA